MVNFCCVVGCSNRSNRDRGVSFFCIPTVLLHHGDHSAYLSKERREKWIANIKRDGWVPSKSSRVCSAHFVRGKPAYLHDTSNPDWAPTQNMGYSRCETREASEHHQQLTKRKRKADDMATASILLELHKHHQDVGITEQNTFTEMSGVNVQTELTMCDISSLEERIKQLEKDNIALRGQVHELEERTKQTGLQEQDFKDDDAKLYTGLPSLGYLLNIKPRPIVF